MSEPLDFSSISSTRDLPVIDVLTNICQTLNDRHELVLQAPPGAGKTTCVPLALLNASWLSGKKILMLEPRRIAAKSAAKRMADLLGERLGETVGYRVRLETKVGPNTRIEVVTEGILTRFLLSDPSLEDYGVVIFDEFHERSLDADFGLALALQGRKLFRNPSEGEVPLRLLVMSATIDGTGIEDIIGSNGAAPLIKSEGRQYPVELHYDAPWQAGENIVDRVVSLIKYILSEETGSVLVFLPGQREIKTAAEQLETLVDHNKVVIAPLYGDMSLRDQQIAIQAAEKGTRKIVLATAIAESSLTIDGVRVVLDAGLSREPLFDARTGMARLQTTRVSKASSIQRMGRAGRTEAGVCYRLWSETQQDQLPAYSKPEIMQADLSPLALQMLAWGVSNIDDLEWLTPPPESAFEQAMELLGRLDAAERDAKYQQDWQITSHGQAMLGFPAHPRLAHMLIMGKRFGMGKLACQIAAVVSDRDPLTSYRDVDIQARLNLFDQNGKHHRHLNRLSDQYQKASERIDVDELTCKVGVKEQVGLLLALAYPDRIAQRRSENSFEFRLSNGRSARLPEHDPLQREAYIVAFQLGGRKGSRSDQVFMACSLNSALFDGPLKDLSCDSERVEWDTKLDRFTAEQQRLVGALTISSTPLKQIPDEAKTQVLLDLVRKRGIDMLPWTDELKQWQARILLLRNLGEESSSWPDVSDQGLLASMENWLAPHLLSIQHINGFAKLDLKSILMGLLEWPLPQELDQLAPVRIQVPSGSNLAIDYLESPPVLSVKLQEMFGATETPSVARGKVPLMIHLLSPAQRPLAVTQDLANFWVNVYPEVKKEMKGRYPKHHWPDSPLEAQATARAKPGNR